MKLNKIAMVVSAAVCGLTLGSATVCLAEAQDNKDSNVLAVDSKLGFHYTAQYRKEADKKGDSDIKTNKYTSEKNDFSHGAGFNFDTGYLNDILGVEIGATFVNPLYVKKGLDAVHAPTNYKGVDATGNKQKDGGETFAKIQQVYLKGHYVYDDIDLKAGYGVTQRNLLTFKDCTSKIANANSHGYDLSVTGEGLTAYFTSILGGSKGKSSKFVTRLQKDAEDFAAKMVKDELALGNTVTASLEDSGLYITGLNYEFEGVSLGLEYGIGKLKGKFGTSGSEKDLKIKDDRYLVKLGYKFDLDEDLSLDLDARYGHNKLAITDANDEKSSFYNLNATAHYDHAFLTLGYSKIKDGVYHDKYFAGNIPSLGSSAAFDCSLNLEEEYNLENEQAFLVKLGYDFTAVGVDGFRAETWYAKGTDAKINGEKIEDFSRKEFGVKLCYDFQEDLKGLKLSYKYANYRASADMTSLSNDNKEALEEVGAINKYDEHRVTLSYAYDMWK